MKPRWRCSAALDAARQGAAVSQGSGLQAFRISILFLFWASLSFWQCAAQDVFSNGTALETEGKFREAAQLYQAKLQDSNLPPADRKRLEFKVDRLERIKKDYPLTKEALTAALKKAIDRVSDSEIEAWLHQGRFDSLTIDGEQRFMWESVPNLFWRHPGLSSRRTPPKNTRQYEQSLLATSRQIKLAAQTQGRSYVLPKQFRVEMKVVAEPNAAPEGQSIRAWLPIPRDYPFQHGFHLLSGSGSASNVAPADSSIRSVYVEQTARTNQPTTFKIEYEYQTEGVRFEIKPERVRPPDLSLPELRPFVAEAPHVVFTPEMRALGQHIAAGQSNPYLKAKLFYEWISENIQYSFAREYSTIGNLGDYCRTNHYGDCGQEAFLFMTLCRESGIPARWQSGWTIFPGGKSIHDWCEIYIAPYGWIPVDPYLGIFAMQYTPSLNASEKHELRDFYFGGLDQYRLIANSDHNQQLAPSKISFRSDNVDFQRGELECGGRNIYFDLFSYELNAEELKPKPNRLD